MTEEYRACVTDHSERHTVDCNACVHGGDVRAWLVTEEYRVGVSGEWFFTCLSFSHPQRQSADETQRQSVDHRSATCRSCGCVRGNDMRPLVVDDDHRQSVDDSR